MAATVRRRNPYGALFGMARELGMDTDALHEYVFRETGRTSLTQLTPEEVRWLERVLGRMKDGALRRKRTDTGGSPSTVYQRRKIYALTGELGWNDDNRRVNGFVKSQFGIERLEWLDSSQCARLIETLKDMVRRGYGKEAGPCGAANG